MLALLLACAASPPPPPEVVPPMAHPTADNSAVPAGYPWARLDVPGRSVIELEGGPTPPGDLGIVSWRGFIAEQPTVWLFVLEFPDQATGLAAAGVLEEWGPPPYYVKTTMTGAWMLLTGFPGDKPVSPQMEDARTAFLSAFAGEE